MRSRSPFIRLRLLQGACICCQDRAVSSSGQAMYEGYMHDTSVSLYTHPIPSWALGQWTCMATCI